MSVPDFNRSTNRSHYTCGYSLEVKAAGDKIKLQFSKDQELLPRMPVASTVAQMNVPLLDLKAQYATIANEIRSAVDRVMESQHFILGPEVSALEQEIAAYAGVACGIGMSSGTDALLAAL